MAPAPKRIVSLLASGTELVCALGLGDRLVGRSHECDYPEWVKSLPEVSHPTFDIAGSSYEIDQHVRKRLRAGEPLYEVDEAQLLQLMPDVLITQTHCEVCAVSPADIAHGLPSSLKREKVIAMTASNLEGILQEFSQVASILGMREQGARLISEIRRSLAQLTEKTGDLSRPTVVCLEWIDPPFAMGNWGPELVEIAGGVNLLGAAGAHSTTTPWQAVRDADPEVLVVASCGFTVERTLRETHVLTSLPGWSDLRAVKNKRVYIADGNLYFNRSGPKLFETPEILAELLHPDLFPPLHRGAWWRALFS